MDKITYNNQFASFEYDVVNRLQWIINCSEDEAQSIVDAQPQLLKWHFENDSFVEETAEAIDKASIVNK